MLHPLLRLSWLLPPWPASVSNKMMMYPPLTKIRIIAAIRAAEWPRKAIARLWTSWTTSPSSISAARTCGKKGNQTAGRRQGAWCELEFNAQMAEIMYSDVNPKAAGAVNAFGGDVPAPLSTWLFNRRTWVSSHPLLPGSYSVYTLLPLLRPR